jgi:hypothetical protein
MIRRRAGGCRFALVALVWEGRMSTLFGHADSAVDQAAVRHGADAGNLHIRDAVIVWALFFLSTCITGLGLWKLYDLIV